MNVSLGKVVKEKLEIEDNQVESKDDKNCDYDRFVFTNCRKVKPKEIQIQTNPRSPDWQVGFFDADGEVYFDEIEIEEYGSFSSIVRNYWWNGKEREKKKEGYYSLIKSVKELQMEEKHVNDLLDYVEGRYEAGEHWQLHELDRNMELVISEELEEATVERLQKYFDNICFDDMWRYQIIADLKAVNNIICNCKDYLFRNCKGVVPQKLVINATAKHIYFRDPGNEVHISEIVMEKKADLKNIIQNKYGEYKHEKRYSLLPHIQTLVIRNNPKVLYDLADYINGRYKISSDNWWLHELNKNMKIVIEKPGTAFNAAKEISDYFANVLVDNNNSEQYFARQQPYQKSFQEHFDKYDLKTDQIGNIILASWELRLKGGKLNVGGSSRSINQLYVNQKLAPQQFVCFHDTDKPVIIDKIIIRGCSDLRCVLQNAYYNGTDSGFFSLLKTVKELFIYSNQIEDNQVLVDLANYIKGKYALNANWKQEELDRDMRINIDNGRYSLSLSVAQRLRNYFKDISIDRIWTQLQTENIIDQSCEDKYMFYGSREANPQKLTINAKLMGNETLIAFKQANGKVYIPEITIDEQGCFAAIVRNGQRNYKTGNKRKSRFYSLVQHVEILTIRNNPGALTDFTDYVVGKYEIEKNKWESHWKYQQLSKNIKIVIQGPGDAFLHVLRISNYFNEVNVDGKQLEDYLATQEIWKNPDYKAFRNCFQVCGLFVEPLQYGIEAKKNLQLIDYVYNIRKSMGSIESLTVRQKLDINSFVCFHDINKPIAVNKILIEKNGDLRNVLQNAYYKKGKAGFFSLLTTAKRLEILDNKQTVENLANYIDGKYTLHPKWRTYVLDKDMVIKIHYDKYHDIYLNIYHNIYYDKHAFSLDVARKLRNYFRNVSINRIKTPLRIENVIDQKCEDQYIFTNSRVSNPQKLVINAKLKGNCDLILFNDADDKACIPEITIGEHGSFDAIVRNQWQNYSGYRIFKYYYYSLVSHVKTLIIQNNPEAVCDLDSYVSGNYQINKYHWDVQKLSKNTTIRISGVNGLDEQINRLKDYFGHIFVDDRKALGNQRRQAITNIQLGNDKIQQQSTANADKRNTIAQADTNIAETRRGIERARARLRRRRARFQEYIALAE